MRRKLSVIEHIVFKKFKKDNIQFVFTVGIEGAFNLEELYNAIAKLRNKHPLLSKKVIDSKWTYFIPDEKNNIPVRVVERLDDTHWLKEEFKELNLLFDLTDGPLVRFVWLKGDRKSELLFTVHHLIADGRAAAFVFRDIIYCLDNQNYKVDSYPFLPGIVGLIPKDISNFKFKLRNKLISYKAIAKIKREELKKEKKKNTVIENNDIGFTVLHWSLNEKMTKMLIKKSGEHNASVQSAIHVALLEACQKVLGKEVVPSIVKVPADIRHKLSDVLKSDSLGTSFAVPLNIHFQYKRRKNFWVMAAEVKKKLQEQLAFKNIYDEIIQLEYMKPVVSNLIKNMLIINNRGKDEITISNLGNIRMRQELETLKVNFFKGSSAVVGKHHMLGVIFFAGKINFSLTYGSNNNAKETAIKIKENMDKSFEKALDILFEANDSLLVGK